jgi:hypothetical protein
MNKTRFTSVALTLCVLALARTPAAGITFTNSTLIAAGDTSYDGQDIVVNHCVLTVNGTHAFNSLQAISGALVTHAGGDANNRAHLTVAQNVYVDPASAIDVSGMGFGTSGGPGGGTNGGTAGGYGGYGGGYGSTSGGLAYGSITAPTDLGSGGASGYMSPGGNGGGAVWLPVGGALQVDGLLAACGVESPGDYMMGGAGSGGSVYLTAGTLAGSGAIRADGGIGHGQGGGGGGRMAIYAGAYSFSGTVSARGGTGSQTGGAGTIFTKLNGQALGSLLVDNGANWGQPTPVSAPVSLQLSLSNCATVCPQGTMTVYSLHLATNTILTCLNGQTGLVLTVLEDAWMDRGSVFTVDGAGFNSTSGPGGATNAGTGGSYGGQGGSYGNGSGGPTYGLITAPVDAGSGGGTGYMSNGGRGGGAIRLDVSGKLQLDGLLTANGLGSPGDYKMGGGGSGGGLFLTVGTLSGNGVIQANGGSGGAQGAGGGGRIALYFNTNSFAGPVTACGGSVTSGQPGGAGTVFTKASAAAHGLVLIDNGGTNGTTRLDSSLWPSGQVFDLTVAGADRVYARGLLSVNDLVLASGASLTCDAGSSAGVSLTALGSVRIDTNTSINVTGDGYGSGSGPGYGGGGAGGGYGGAGGGSGGGGTYGSSYAPVDLGSGGGGGYMSSGGSGGGVIRLCVAGALQLDGSLEANGVASSGDYAMGGAGSGGSIYVTVSSFVGTGLINAQGGSGGQGGGGGGRIAVYSLNTPTFTGTSSAAGGTGGDAGRNGQNGTVYLGTGVVAISGAVNTTNGWPVRGLTIQTLDASASTLTDTNGMYTLLVAPGWSGTIQPQLAGASFLPANRLYSTLSANEAGQDYSLLSNLQPSSTVTLRASALSMTWPSIPGLHYQVKNSDDLKTWLDYNSPQIGTGGTLTNSYDTHSAPRSFFRLVVSP